MEFVDILLTPVIFLPDGYVNVCSIESDILVTGMVLPGGDEAPVELFTQWNLFSI